jgi:methionyl-tRNA synthetase
MPEKILITSALPYANGPLHFGHIAGAYLPADVYARFKRLYGDNVLYICGSDEYGFAITISAEMAKRSPQEHVDLYHQINKDFFEKLDISFDHYGRTTCIEHKKPVQEFFLNLLEKGYIEERITDQLFSEKENKFLADRYVTGTCPRCKFEGARGDECQKCGASYDATDLINPRSKLTGSKLSLKSTKHWFLLLEKFEKNVQDFLSQKHWKSNVVQFAKNYTQNLHARAITRDSDWGVPVPLEDAKGKVLYVWFDAPIGYISATMSWANYKGKPDAWKDFWLDKNTKLVQFIGKDNIPFHAVIFPAMVMGQNLPFKLVDELPANEFYNLEGKRFSKSDGWYIDLADFFTRYTTDQIRYAIASNAPENADSEFNFRDFQMHCNAELAGKFGNFANRVLVFAKNYCDQKVPELSSMQEVDVKFLKDIDCVIDEIAFSYSNFHVRKACQLFMELCQKGNTYFDNKKPWIDVKDEALKDRLSTTINLCLECLKSLCLISFPLIPQSALKLWNSLGIEKNLQSFNWDEIKQMRLQEGSKLKDSEILFAKIEDEVIEKEIHALKERSRKASVQDLYEPLKPLTTFEDFSKMDLRVGEILEAKAVAKSKKLLHLSVDLGFEKRSIVSGIALHYTPEEIIGKKVIVVANLKSALLMGVESQGMILCSGFGDDLEIVEPGNIKLGATVR